MHTEHLQNVHFGWVVAGWLIAAAATSLVLIVLAGLGILGPEGLGAFWSIVAVALGFWTGGLFTGFRSIDAPILHGVSIGVFSLIAWFALNVAVVLFFRSPASWQGLPPALTATLLLLQMVAAVAGAWTGHRIALRGGPDLTE